MAGMPVRNVCSGADFVFGADDGVPMNTVNDLMVLVDDALLKYAPIFVYEGFTRQLPKLVFMYS